MPIAAVPEYLQRADPQFYLSAPPGHRFLLYFAAWGDNQESNQIDWRMKDRVPKMKRQQGQFVQDGWEDQPNDQYACTVAACKVPGYADDRPRRHRHKADPGLKPWLPLIKGLHERQDILAGSLSIESLLRLDALATAPFSTGLGNEHPLENGFAFLNPYGLPYLPGSGVKGVLRQAARELASGDWGAAHGWSDAKTIALMQGEGDRRRAVLDRNKEPVRLSMLDVLFGREAASGETDHLRGALSFWDVIPQLKGDSLAVEIMTPHQSHYYQGKEHAGSTTPHDSGAPNPISFLTVPPASGFAFHVVCDSAHLARHAPELVADERWKTLLTQAFGHAFMWLGFGAKTAVGYGAMCEDLEAKKRKEKADADALKQKRDAQAQQERQAALENMSPADRAMNEFLDARQDKSQPEISALIGGLKKGTWDGEIKTQIAGKVKILMQSAKKWKEKSEKKNPEKDNDHQDTLKVMAWLAGQK